MQIEMFILDGAPQSLDKDVVQGASATIHADADVGGEIEASLRHRRPDEARLIHT